MQRRFADFAAAALLGAALCSSALAQGAFPSRPIHLLVGFPPGGPVDALARAVGDKLGQSTGQPVVVENIPGATGILANQRLARAAPDGYTLVMGADSPIAIARLVNPAAVKYDALKDLAPIGLVNTAPMVLVARPGLPVNNLADVIRLAHEKPGQLSYATSGIGTVLHLAMELIKDQSHAYITHVPYRGGAQIVTDVVGNQVDLAVLVSVTATPQIQSHKVKPIAVTDDKRLAALPDVPTVAETPGFQGYDMVSWTGLFAPAHTPQPIVERLNHEVNEILHSEDVKARMTEQGAIAGSGSAADFGRFVQREQERYARIVRAANIKE